MAAVQGDTLLLRRTRLILQCLVLIGAGLFIFVPLPIKGKITTNQKVRFRRQREESQTDSSIGKITKKDDPVEYEYDAVIIPGGGVKANGAPKESVVARLDEAAYVGKTVFLVFFLNILQDSRTSLGLAATMF